MNFLLLALKTLDPYKEFIVLVCILLAILSLVVIVTKAYMQFKVKQTECDGRFKLIERTADESRSESREALKIVKSVESCTDKIKITVDEIKSDFDGMKTDFLEGKYAKKEKSAG